MGTKVQSKPHFPGYHSGSDQNKNMCNNTRDPFREAKISENSEYHNSFLRTAAIDEHAGYAKDYVKQTMLKQESIFRDQLLELHRLYHKQKELMRELVKPSLNVQKDCRYINSQSSTSQGRMFGLELPADQGHGSGLFSKYVGDPLGSTSCTTRNDSFADLNKPFPVEQASVNSLNNTICLKDESRRMDKSNNSNSGFWVSPQFTRSFRAEREGANCLSERHSFGGMNKKEMLPYNFSTGNTVSPIPANSFQVESRKMLDHSSVPLSGNSKSDPQRKRKIFGSQICEGKQELSLNNQSDITDAESSLTLPWQKTSNSWHQNVVARNDNLSLAYLDPSSWAHEPVGQIMDFPGGKLYANDDYLRSISSSKFKGSDFVNLKSSNDVNQPAVFQNGMPPQQWKHEFPTAGLPWKTAKMQSSVGHKGKEIPYMMNLDSLKNHSQHFFKTDSTNGASNVVAKVSHKTDSNTPMKILGIPITNVHAIKDQVSSSLPFKVSDSIVEAKNHDASLVIDLKEGGLVMQNGQNSCASGFRPKLDLNLSPSEEEPLPNAYTPQVTAKIATNVTAINVPTVLESKIDTSKVADSQVVERKLLSKLPSVDSMDSPGELAKFAAETLMAISSSPSNVLQWFAEVITSDDINSISDACTEESIPEGMDEFEYLTLNLKEMTEDEYICKPVILEAEKDEKAPPKRARKGQGRKGRQRKDFQTDILPSIASLARRDVTDDMRTFEESFAAKGVSWQSSMSKKVATRGSKAKKRVADNDPSPLAAEASPAQVKQPGTTPLSGWGKGKRTRRLPRQRSGDGNENNSLSIKG